MRAVLVVALLGAIPLAAASTHGAGADGGFVFNLQSIENLGCSSSGADSSGLVLRGSFLDGERSVTFGVGEFEGPTGVFTLGKVSQGEFPLRVRFEVEARDPITGRNFQCGVAPNGATHVEVLVEAGEESQLVASRGEGPRAAAFAVRLGPPGVVYPEATVPFVVGYGSEQGIAHVAWQPSGLVLDSQFLLLDGPRRVEVAPDATEAIVDGVPTGPVRVRLVRELAHWRVASHESAVIDWAPEERPGFWWFDVEALGGVKRLAWRINDDAAAATIDVEAVTYLEVGERVEHLATLPGNATTAEIESPGRRSNPPSFRLVARDAQGVVLFESRAIQPGTNDASQPPSLVVDLQPSLAIPGETVVADLRRTTPAPDARIRYLDATFFEVDWGDGTSASSRHGVFSHAYARPGNYTVDVEATDLGGGKDEQTLRVDVVATRAEPEAPPPHAPTATPETEGGNEVPGESLLILVSAFAAAASLRCRAPGDPREP